MATTVPTTAPTTVQAYTPTPAAWLPTRVLLAGDKPPRQPPVSEEGSTAEPASDAN
jgi:hypothetical protein